MTLSNSTVCSKYQSLTSRPLRRRDFRGEVTGCQSADGVFSVRTKTTTTTTTQPRGLATSSSTVHANLIRDAVLSVFSARAQSTATSGRRDPRRTLDRPQRNDVASLRYSTMSGTNIEQVAPDICPGSINYNPNHKP